MLALIVALFVSQAPATSFVDPAPGARDDEPPTIDDFAVASENPAAPPMITAVFSDDVSGVKSAAVFFRRVGDAAYEQADFTTGTSGIFIARLPDGLQRSGFEYFVEVTDAAGNPPARLGSADRPLVVPAAVESAAAREQRRAVDAHIDPAIHPAWTMAALGAGIALGAGAGVFAYDWNATTGQLAAVDEHLATRPGDEAALARRAALQNAQVLDATLGTLLGVAAVAGLATGITLAALTAAE